MESKCEYCKNSYIKKIYNQRYCSLECKYQKMLENRRLPVIKKECLYCGKEFETNRPRQQFCCKTHCGQYNAGHKYTGRKESHDKEDIQKILETKYSHINYVGDYTGGDTGSLFVECKDCGLIWRMSNQILKPSKNSKCECSNCRKIVSELNKEKLQQDRFKEKEYDFWNQNFEQARFITNESTCECCGRLFAYSDKRNRKYCSEECSKRVSNRTKEHVTKLRIRNNKVDTISLRKLYERDNGICYICGIKCNWNDYIQTEKAFIAGSTYPSHDHVIPKSKGGMHSWDNAKLACRKCNWEKGDKIANG